jgi:hypothetical protein
MRWSAVHARTLAYESLRASRRGRASLIDTATIDANSSRQRSRVFQQNRPHCGHPCAADRLRPEGRSQATADVQRSSATFGSYERPLSKGANWQSRPLAAGRRLGLATAKQTADAVSALLRRRDDRWFRGARGVTCRSRRRQAHRSPSSTASPSSLVISVYARVTPGSHRRKATASTVRRGQADPDSPDCDRENCRETRPAPDRRLSP